MELLNRPRARRPDIRRRALVCTLAALGLPSVRAQTVDSDASTRELEYEVKGAFLIKFGEFVDWPAHAFGAANAPFTISVLGSDLMFEVLEQLARQRAINGRPIRIRRAQLNEPIPPSQILFVAQMQTERLRAAADALMSAGVLTVTENSQPPQPSGIINFVIRDNRVRFEIDADAAEQAGLKISSKVLSLAVAVKGQRQK